MHPEWFGKNNKGLAIVRVSSKRQEGNISHETQEKEILEYCSEMGIQIVETRRIVESAKDSEDRKKYSDAINFALSEGIRHVLFYMYDRETRNLTDAEKNAKLVRADLICLHYVRESKVLHKDSPSTDFFMRNIHAVMNTQFIDTLRTRVNDVMREKAESGWFPSNHVPTGYVLQRLKDENGKPLKRGSIIVKDPDEKIVHWVFREFELRARGHSFEDIRKRCLFEGLVPAHQVATYRANAIEKHIHNPFYEGKFVWKDKIYEGKHEIIIPPALLEQARAARRGNRKPRPDAQYGVFGGGWMRCSQCDCVIVYDPKKKVYRTTGGTQTFHYYHCTNGKKKHLTMAGMSVTESEIWVQMDRAIASIHMTKELAGQIAEALNESHRHAILKSKELIARHKDTLQALEVREDSLYENLISGVLDSEAYKRQLDKLRGDRKRIQDAIQELQGQLNAGYRENALSVLELCRQAPSLYSGRSPAERRSLLERILSNPRLNGTTIEFDLRKPFSSLALINETGDWRPHLDKFRTECASLHGELYRGKRPVKS